MYQLILLLTSPILLKYFVDKDIDKKMNGYIAKYTQPSFIFSNWMGPQDGPLTVQKCNSTKKCEKIQSKNKYRYDNFPYLAAAFIQNKWKKSDIGIEQMSLSMNLFILYKSPWQCSIPSSKPLIYNDKLRTRNYI